MLASATVFLIATAVSFSADGAQGKREEKPFSAEQVQFFETKVQPILKARCLKCHGDGPKIRGGFRLDSREAVLQGRRPGPGRLAQRARSEPAAPGDPL